MTEYSKTWINLLVLVCFCCLQISYTASPPSVPSGVLITTDITNNSIWSIDLADRSRAEIVMHYGASTRGVKPTAVVYDPVEDLIYWADNVDQHITRVYRNGTVEPEDIAFYDSATHVAGLALDPTSRILFYADYGEKVIGGLSLRDTVYHSALIDTGLSEPWSITVDPENRKIYWSDIGKNTIESADMDGSNISVIVDSDLGSPVALTYDQTDKKLYWCDKEFHAIESFDVTTRVREVIINATGECSGIGVDSQNIYYTHFNSSHVMYINKQNHADRGIFDQFNGFGLLHGVAVYASNNAYSGGSPCDNNNGGCAQLCFPSGGNDVRCACSDGRGLLEDMANCTKGRYNHGTSLIYSLLEDYDYSGLYGFEDEPSSWFDLPYVPSPWSIGARGFSIQAMDFHYQKKQLFASDTLGRRIVSFTLDGSVEWYPVFTGTSEQVHGIAVDWVHNNIYWTDSSFNWIMMASIEENTNKTRVIVDTELEVPWGIAVHPHMGYIFWTDYGDQPKIVRASLDGTNRQQIVYSGLNKPRGITVDFSGNKLYWTNDNKVESCDLNGSNRQIVVALSLSMIYFTDITYHDGYLFIADQGWMPSPFFPLPRLVFWKISPGKGFYVRMNGFVHGIVMYSEGRQPYYENVCAANPCDHFCVSNGTGTAVHVCVCADGYKLHANGHSCIEETDVLGPLYITSYGEEISIVDARHDLLSQGTVRSKGRNWTSVDVDYDGRSIFLAHNGAGATIDHVHLQNLNMVDNIVRGVDNVTDLAVDWISSTLYWTEGSYGQIWVSRLDGTYQKILKDRLVQPESICVHPLRKKMYWTVGGASKLQMSNLDNTTTQILRSTDGAMSSLTIDILDSRLYYVDRARGHIHYILLDNPSYHRYFSSSYNVISLTIFQDFITFLSPVRSANNEIGVVRAYIEGRGILDPVFPIVNRTVGFDIVAYSKDNQPLARGSCDISNGGCEQLCLVNPTSRTCACVDGMRLMADGKTCQPNYIVKGDFFLIADDYRHAIYQADDTFNDISAFKIPQVEWPMSADFDSRDRVVYWTDQNTGIVKRMNASGSEPEVVKDNSAHRDSGSIIERIAVDPVSRLLYYTDSGLNRIGVISLTDISVHKILIEDDQALKNPSSIALDPMRGTMYYAVRGVLGTRQGKIEMANMDGSNRTTIVQALDSPTGIAIVPGANQLYWCDQVSEKVEAIGFNGQGRRLVKQLPSTSNPFAITLQGRDGLFLTDGAARGVWSMSKGDGSNYRSYKSYFFTGLNEIKFIPYLGIQHNNCTSNNGGCSHICLPKQNNPPSNMVCACPDGFALGPNGRDCPGATTCPHQIPNGFLQEQCSRRVDAECQFICMIGYSMRISHIKCLSNGQWDQDLNTLCQRRVCVPPSINNAHVVSCNTTIGSECLMQCNAGYERDAGTERRKCLRDLTWDGSDLVCKASGPVPTTTRLTTHSTPPTTTPGTIRPIPITTQRTKHPLPTEATTPAIKETTSIGAGGITGKNKGENTPTGAPSVGGGTIAGIIVGLILIIVFVVGGIFVWKKFWPNMKAGRYIQRNQNSHVRFENERDYGGIDSLPQNIPAVMYNSPTDELHFENPIYDTINPSPRSGLPTNGVIGAMGAGGFGPEKPLDAYHPLDEIEPPPAYEEKHLPPVEESPRDLYTALRQEPTVQIKEPLPPDSDA